MLPITPITRAPSSVFDHPAAAAHQARSADHHGGDDVEFRADPDRARAHPGAARADDARQGRQGAGEDVDRHDVARRRDARQADRLGVGPDRLHDPAELGEVQDDPSHEKHREHQDHRLGHAEEEARAEIRQRLARVAHHDGLAGGQDQGGAARRRHHGERDDEGRQFRVGHQHAGDGAGERPGAERCGHRRRRPGGACGDEGAADAAERQERADRQVDAARQDHEEHAHRHDAGGRDLSQHVHDVAFGQEGARLRGRTHDQNDEDRRGAVSAEQLRHLHLLALALGQVVGDDAHVSSLSGAGSLRGSWPG